MPKGLSARSWWFVATCIIICAALLSLAFARVQSVWGDETTQLAGITLSPMDVLHWLAGKDAYRFGVPPDRMPPLSYWLGIGWSYFFGVDAFAMRMLSVAASVCGLVALAATVRRISPGLISLCVFGLFALSLNFTHYSVEIRTYPFVLALACCTMYATLRYLEERNHGRPGKWLAGICASLMLSTGFHYTSCIFSLALMGALGLLAIYERRNVWPIVGACVVSASPIAFLLPLVKAQMQIKTAVLATELIDVPRYFFRLFANRADAMSTPVLVSTVLSKLLLIAVSGKAALDDRKELSTASALWVVCAIASLAGISGMVLGGFFLPVSMMQPHYSIWLWPMVCVLMIPPADVMRNKLLRQAHLAALVAASLATLITLAIFVRNMPAFVHGPANHVAELAMDAGPNAPIIYDLDDTDGWNVYYPMRLAFGESRPQYFARASAAGVTYYDAHGYLAHVAGTPMPPIAENPVAGATALVFVRAAMFEYPQLRAYLLNGIDNLENTGAEERLAKAHGMEIVSKTFVPGITSARIIVMRKK